MFQGRLQEGQMDLIVTNHTGKTQYIDVTVVSPVVNNPSHLSNAAKKPGYAALRAEYGKRQRYPVDAIVPFALELGGRPGPTAQTFVRDLFTTEGSTRDISIAGAWSSISSALHDFTSSQIHKAAPQAA